MGNWDNTNRDYFVYTHHKADTNELFYVGIGKRRKGTLHSQVYLRAYQCSSYARNYLWLRCYNKHGRTIRILYDNLTEKECKEKEIELISKYGRLIDGTGVLCNISGGGEGRFRDKSNNKKIYVYNLQGILINTFPSCNEAADFYGLERRNVGAAANMKRHTAGDYQFRYEYNKGVDLLNLNSSTRKSAKPIICRNVKTGQELYFSSAYKFQHYIGDKSTSHIMECLNGKRRIVKGWELRYQT